MVLLTTLTLAAVAWYACTAEKQWAEMVTANRQSREALQTSERAWVLLGAPPYAMPAKTGECGHWFSLGTVVVTLRNHGKGPAFDLTQVEGFQDACPASALVGDPLPWRFMLAPGEYRDDTTPVCIYDKSRVKAFKRRGIYLVLYLTYRDQFRIGRHTQVCIGLWRTANGDVFTRVEPTGNYAD